MTTTATQSDINPTAASPRAKRLSPPHRRLFNRAEFQQILDAGVFGAEERFELINGEIVAKERPVNTPHATSQGLAEDVFREVFGTGYVVRAQVPLALGQYAEPLPDIAIVTGNRRDYEAEHPTTAVLVLEISDTTLRHDRTTKARLYARAGILEYWILNLTKRRLEVYREPRLLRGPDEYHYASRTLYQEGDSVTPLAMPQASVAARDLLPRS